MKLLIYLVFFILIPLTGDSQPINDISKIESELTERPWLDHSVHELNGYKITKIFGERDARQRHSNMGSITTISYLDSKQLMEQLDSLDITPAKKEQLEKEYANARGGAIRLFITRITQSRANFRWFFIVIRGEDDEEKIMEIDLKYQPSQLPDANGWWNYETILLPEPLELPFYVYVNDRQSQYLSDFKFMVNR